MTHSWGTSFSSQPKNHAFPRKIYTYFVSRAFMTLAHLICPWNELVVRTASDAKRESKAQAATRTVDEPDARPHGSIGKQYFLGLNFAELEFDFDAGAVNARIFGTRAGAPPELELRWTFDQLSGDEDLPGATATLQDFLQEGNKQDIKTEREWICVPHRGLASPYHEYLANIGMFLTFCILFFLPHGVFVYLLALARRRWTRQNLQVN